MILTLDDKANGDVLPILEGLAIKESLAIIWKIKIFFLYLLENDFN
jgi:hypothetical protein